MSQVDLATGTSLSYSPLNPRTNAGETRTDALYYRATRTVWYVFHNLFVHSRFLLSLSRLLRVEEPVLTLFTRV